MKLPFRKLIVVLIIFLSLPIGVYLALTKTSFFNRASGTPANIQVDFSEVGSEDLSEPWRNLAQGGEETSNSLESVTGPVRDLRPRYIRIDHVFDMYTQVSKDGSGGVSVDWKLLDSIIKSIQDTGAKPFISLSYMAPQLASDGDKVSEPANWAEWKDLVKKTVEHVSGRGGLNIDDVYYEVWNEPDLFGNFKIGGKKNYPELYSNTVSGALMATNVNSFKIGGPATTDLYESWFRELIRMKQGGTRVDFFSWHKYTTNIDEYATDWDKIAAWSGEMGFDMNGIELVITESGPDPKNNKAYDNVSSAMHVIAVNSVLAGKVDKIFTFEIKDGPGPEKNWGRWGIFTNDKYGTPEKKPRYSALQYLNRMRGVTIPVRGNGSWVSGFAKKDGETFRLMIVNYDSYGSHGESVPIRITNMPYKNFTLRRVDFSGARSEAASQADDNNVWEANYLIRANQAFILEFAPI